MLSLNGAHVAQVAAPGGDYMFQRTQQLNGGVLVAFPSGITPGAPLLEPVTELAVQPSRISSDTRLRPLTIKPVRL